MGLRREVVVVVKRGELKRKTPIKRGDSQLKRTRIAPRSRKMKAIYTERQQLVRSRVGRPCQMKTPVCTGRTETLHERWTRGRSGNTAHAILCPANVVDSCLRCNAWVEENMGLAEEMGLIVKGSDGCPCGEVK